MVSKGLVTSQGGSSARISFWVPRSRHSFLRSSPPKGREQEIQKGQTVKNIQQLQEIQIELLRDMFIAQLILAGISQREIAKVVRVNLNRVNRLGKSLKKRKGGN